MDRNRNAPTQYFKSHTSERSTASTSYSYSSSSSYDMQHITANSLKYSPIGNTRRQLNHDTIKSKFLADASLTKPGLINVYDAQPFRPPAQQIVPSIPTVAVNRNNQTHTATPPRHLRSPVPPHKQMAPVEPQATVSNPNRISENTPPTSLFARAFSFRSRKRGYALILNHEKFKLSGKPPRVGTHHDVNKLKSTFNLFNIETHVKNDLTLAEIQNKVKKLKKTDFSKYECFILVILTHGDDAHHIYAKDAKYEFVDVIEDPVINENKTLLDKPKIIILHTSRDENSRTFQTDAVPIVLHKTVVKRNIFKCNATHFERAILKGTFFVQNFCQHLQTTGKIHHLYEVMMLVIADVSNNSDESPEIPTIESTMTKTFSFGQLLVNQKK